MMATTKKTKLTKAQTEWMVSMALTGMVVRGRRQRWGAGFPLYEKGLTDVTCGLLTDEGKRVAEAMPIVQAARKFAERYGLELMAGESREVVFLRDGLRVKPNGWLEFGLRGTQVFGLASNRCKEGSRHYGGILMALDAHPADKVVTSAFGLLVD